MNSFATVVTIAPLEHVEADAVFDPAAPSTTCGAEPSVPVSSNARHNVGDDAETVKVGAVSPPAATFQNQNTPASLVRLFAPAFPAHAAQPDGVATVGRELERVAEMPIASMFPLTVVWPNAATREVVVEAAAPTLPRIATGI